MTNSLQQQVHRVGVRARTLIIVHGLACVVTCTVLTAFLLGWVDYLVEIQDRGVRCICLSAFLLVMGWSMTRFLVPALTSRFRDVSVARRIERRFPQLEDRLSSTIQFLNQPEDEPTAGSASLRRAVIAETAAEVEQLSLLDAIDIRRPTRAVLVASMTTVAVALICLFDISGSWLAARRLAIPWGNNTWHDLEFRPAPRRIAAGDDFDVELIDRNGSLPRSAQLHYWFDGDDESAIRREEMARVGDTMVHRLRSVMRPFKFRAVGGDDHSMEWIALEVTEPPRIASMQVTLHPPGYTGWPAESSDRNIRALEGTRVQIQGISTKQLTSASLSIDAGSEPTDVDLEISKDGLEFSIPADGSDGWVIGKSGAYSLQLHDTDQLVGGSDSRYQISAMAHRAPSVSLEKPGANSFVTADAVVALKAMVKDDLTIHMVQIRYSRSDRSQAGEEWVELYRGSDQVPAKAASGLDPAGGGDIRLVQYDWDLSSLDRIPPGTQIVFHVMAANYKPLVGQSTSRRVTIITPDQLDDRIANRQRLILNQLAGVLKKQNESRTQTSMLKIQVEQAGGLSKRDLDHLQSAELNQRQVTRLLKGDVDGVRKQIQALLDDLAGNRVDSPDVERRMSGLIAAIDRMGREHLPVIQRLLITARKRSQDGEPDELQPAEPEGEQSRVGELLDEAGQHQDQVLAALERMLLELSQWDNYRRFARELSQLRRDQQQLNSDTTQLRDRTLTRDPTDITQQDRADQLKLSRRQLGLARQLDKILSQMDQMQNALSETDPLASQTITDALEVAQRLSISASMRQGGHRIDRNQPGQATKLQEQAVRDLQEVLDTLANRREHELGRLVRKLNEASGQLEQLKKEQQDNLDQLEKAGAVQDENGRRRELERFIAEQERLQKRLDRLARQLQRLRAEQAASQVGRAAQRTGQSAQAGGQGDQPRAEEQARLADDRLDQAQQHLRERIKQVEQELFEEQLAKLEQTLEGLHQQQETILDEVERLDQLRAAQGRLTRGQLVSLGDAARNQHGLIAETRRFAEKIVQARVFHLGLQGAAHDMADAAGRLDRRETGESTRQVQRDASSRLARLLEALQEGDENNGDDAGGGGQGGGSSNASDGIASMAELKLLKLMQSDINQKTTQIQELRSSQGRLKPDQQRQLVSLAREQGQLAALIFDLSEPDESRPEQNPENLPAVDDEELLDPELEKALEGVLDPLQDKE